MSASDFSLSDMAPLTGLAIYRGATALAAPAMRWMLERRARSGQEDPSRLGERFGRASRPRPYGRLVWLHAASVGESLSALPLVERLTARQPDMGVLVTTGTVTSAQLMSERLPAGAIHQFVPLDHPLWVRRFLDHWRPDLALWIESELWLNLLAETQGRGIPTGLLNGRLSARSFRRWRACGGVLLPILRSFAVCLAQNSDQVARLATLGAVNARTVGNLKYAARPVGGDRPELAALREQLAGRRLWLAASTHRGEELLAAEAHRQLRAERPDLLTIIAPRHPDRGAEIAAALAERGLSVARRSLGEAPTDGSDVYLADTLGELGLFYRLAGISLVGGSFAEHGGHNPIEPALEGCVILYGPDMTNFAEVATALEAAGGALRLDHATALAPAVARLLDDPQERRRRTEAGRRVAEAEAGVLERVLAELEPLLGATTEGRS